MPPEIANTQMAAAWDGDEGAHWAHNADRYDASARWLHPRLMAAAEIEPGERVLDIGCGAGQVTIEAARAATGGLALGVDLSSEMLNVARERAMRDGVENVSFEHADAQVHPFEDASFDVAISRNGVMFFADRDAAFANIARAVRPGGRLTMLVWQGIDRNDWLREIFEALAAGRPLPAPEPGAPGPASMADPDATRAMLQRAGFDAIALASVEDRVWFGRDAGDAYDFVKGTGVGRGLLSGLEPEAAAAALKSLRAMLERFHGPDGVTFDAAAWLISARRP